MVKRCSYCKENLPLTAFGKNRRQADGLQNYCNHCRRVYWNDWYKKRKASDPTYLPRLNANQIRVSLQRELRKYELTMPQYLKLAEQGCKICGGGPNGRGRFHFDHAHKTGKFRGLLCHNCNTAIGLLKENPQLLTKAITYLGI